MTPRPENSSNLLDEAEAREVALAEKPLRDIARMDDTPVEDKAVLDKTAVRLGDKAQEAYREKKLKEGYRDSYVTDDTDTGRSVDLFDVQWEGDGYYIRFVRDHGDGRNGIFIGDDPKRAKEVFDYGVAVHKEMREQKRIEDERVEKLVLEARGKGQAELRYIYGTMKHPYNFSELKRKVEKFIKKISNA